METERSIGSNGDDLGWEGPAREAMDQVKSRLTSVDKFLRTAARERPILTLGVALGVGYLLGRIIGR